LLTQIRHLSVCELLLYENVKLTDFGNRFTDIRETQQQLLAHTHTPFTERQALQDRDQLRHQNATFVQEAKATTVDKAQLTKFSQTRNDFNLNLRMKAKDTVGARLFMRVKALNKTDRPEDGSGR
jgi:hypothetical protein